MLMRSLAAASAGPFLAVCTLLVVSGLSKLRSGEAAQTALAAAGVRMPAAGVAGIGAVELGAGIAGAAFGRVAALVVAALSLALAAFAVRLLVRAPATPCACLGS